MEPKLEFSPWHVGQGRLRELTQQFRDGWERVCDDEGLPLILCRGGERWMILVRRSGFLSGG